MLSHVMNSSAPPDPAATRLAYQKELLSNQVWQGMNFLSKAGFLLLLTPLMIAHWGTEGYGLFALASSLLVSMALIDGGVRALTRLRLAEALRLNDQVAYREAYWSGVVTFACVAGAVFAAALVLGFSGIATSVLKLPPGGDVVLMVTVGLTGFFMLSTLVLEPIAAAGNLSLLKAANTIGALAAIPLCAAALFLNGGVLLVSVLYSLSFIIPCVVQAWQHKIYAIARPKNFRIFDLRVVVRTLREGRWFYLTTVALIFKTHALTFVVSAMAGPAEAGIFYVLLRLTEIIGNVGSTASETSLASLASSTNVEEKAGRFRQSWLYVAVFSLHGAAGIFFLGGDLLGAWLAKDYLLAPGTLATMAIFGLAGSFSRVVVNASMGLNVVRSGALANLAEAVSNGVLAAVGYHLAGLPGLFLGGSLGLVFLLPQAHRIAQLCGSGLGRLFLRPLGGLLPGLLLSSVVLAAAGQSTSRWLWFLGMAAAGVIVLAELRRLHRRGGRTNS